MKRFTVQDIRDLGPCKDPVSFPGIDEDTTGTLVDILRLRQVWALDRIWVASHLVDSQMSRGIVEFLVFLACEYHLRSGYDSDIEMFIDGDPVDRGQLAEEVVSSRRDLTYLPPAIYWATDIAINGVVYNDFLYDVAWWTINDGAMEIIVSIYHSYPDDTEDVKAEKARRRKLWEKYATVLADKLEEYDGGE